MNLADRIEAKIELELIAAGVNPKDGAEGERMMQERLDAELDRRRGMSLPSSTYAKPERVGGIRIN